MHVLVTGGTGFVGSHLIEALRAAGDDVRALVRPGGDRALIERLGAEPFDGDLDAPAGMVDACRDCDVVYHAAARVDIDGDYADFHRTTVNGTFALARAAVAAGVRRFVYVGSCGVYHPRLLREGVIHEETPTLQPPKWFKYGRAKLAAEEAVRRTIGPRGEWCVIRLGYLYGPRNRAMRRYLYPLLAGGKMKYVGRGDNEMAMIHVRDAVSAIVAAGRVPAAAGRTLIAVGDERVTQRDYFSGLAAGLGLPPIRRHLPYRLAYLMAWGAEWLPFKLHGGAFQRAGIVLTGLPQRIDCRRTQAMLNWRPTHRFADGIREACEWYLREYPEHAPVVEPAARTA
ncbi:MAG: NAD-dependent epimerase/dehydratase family protein [Phycisphaerae bacterium]|nr:NAD-dependent epimerase/dehydratase family protein [Phycisphaerae bacterium]NUQ46523.1 NAD-dependent epimerase/dehydratase family protein [Phycisphaerae bacterium]